MYQGEGINALVCAVEDLKNSSFIYIEPSLGKLLKCLAYYDEFKTVLTECMRGFNYELEKQQAMSRMKETYVLRLPSDEKRKVAFVANLLMEFDVGDMDTVTFADRYFPSSSRQESFNMFVEGVIEPFKLALVDLVWNGVPAKSARSVEFSNSGVNQQVEHLIVKLLDDVKLKVVDDGERAQFVTMIEGLAAALDQHDALMIRAIWTGLSRSLASASLCLSELKGIDDALKLYLVIK